MRLSVLNAMVWRLVAEVFRRHSPQHRFSIFESHPGISARGRLHLVLRADDSPLDRCRQVVFNLGGPSGTMDLMPVSGGAVESVPFAQWLLDRDPIEVVDAITRGLGLKVPSSIGPSSPATVAARVLSESLTRESLARKPLGVTSGWVDSSIASGHPAWMALLPSAGAVDDGSRIGSPFVALHEATADESPLMSIGEAPIAIVNLDGGDAALTLGQSVVTNIHLPSEFAASGRRIGPLADRLLAHLSR